MSSTAVPLPGAAARRTRDRLPGRAWRARLGVIVPSVNTVVEPWFVRVLPEGVTVHAARMLLDNDLTPDNVRRMDEEEGGRAVRQLMSCRPDAIAYCCTASSIVQGVEYDAHLQQDLAARSGKPCFTAVRAIIDALGALGARRIAVASPYPDSIDRMEHAYFEKAGFSIAGSANLGITDSFELASPTPEEIRALGLRAWRADADALLVSCLNLHSQDVVQSLEDEIGRPVVTSTTATLWKLLRQAGITDPVPGYGRLLTLP